MKTADDIEREALEGLARRGRKTERAKRDESKPNGHPVKASADNGPSRRTWLDDAFSAADLQKETFPPLAWIIRDIVPAEGACLLCSKPKFGKSWFVLDLCIGCTANQFILGEIKPRQGDVLYLALEDSKRRLQRRMTKLLPTFGAKWPERLTIKVDWRRLHEGGLQDIRAWHDTAKGKGGNPILVVVDVLAKVRKPTGNRQLYEADYEALTGLTKLANELGIAILVVHHVRKMAADDLMETVSGSFGTTGAVDTVLVMANKAGGVVLDIRGRDVEAAELALQFSKETCRWKILGEAAEVHVSEQRTKILVALKEADSPLSVAAIAEATGMTGMKRNSLEALLGRMAKDGAIKRVAKGMYADNDYEPPQDPSRKRKPGSVAPDAPDTPDNAKSGPRQVRNQLKTSQILGKPDAPDAPDPHLADGNGPNGPDLPVQTLSGVSGCQVAAQAPEITNDFSTKGPDTPCQVRVRSVRTESGEAGCPADPYGIPAGSRRCFHCGKGGAVNIVALPDGTVHQLHSDCEAPYLAALDNHLSHQPPNGGAAQGRSS
jgi:hypothetical protein